MIQSPESVNPYDRETGNIFVRAEHLARYLFAAKFIKKHKLVSVLDAACGNGYGSMVLTRQAKSVSGLDRNISLIEQGQYKNKAGEACNVSFQAADLNAGLPMFENNAFDCAVCFETLEHVEKDEELVAEFGRVVRSGGKLLLSVPKEGYEPTGEDGKPENPFHLRLYNEEMLSELLERSGFQVEAVLGQPYSNLLRVRMEDYRRDTHASENEIDGYFADTPEALEFYANLWAWPIKEFQEKSNVLFLICKNIAKK
jgi:ubiquinone/menaquinone biosynthesis C-methylase UbiE